MSKQNKLPGKTEFSGRRRSATRKSGFKSHANATGGELSIKDIDAFELEAGGSITVSFSIQPCQRTGKAWRGFGLWYWADEDLTINVTGCPAKFTLKDYGPGAWSKLGSLWEDTSSTKDAIAVTFSASSRVHLAFYQPACGTVEHDYLSKARPALLKNIADCAPEANFYSAPGMVTIQTLSNPLPDYRVQLWLKTCNRCARSLPINQPPHERQHLSFTNHCVAKHRRPCSHTGFGLLKDSDGGKHKLDYGFQLECRFCKKFEVNAAHNPQRSAAQMKEDSQRRRSFELLLTELLGQSKQMNERHCSGVELVDFVWNRFSGICFNCQQPFANKKAMNLDHTRPLAHLWPLDRTATALCKSCNSSKRDRTPKQFYAETMLDKLAPLTGIKRADLETNLPNLAVLDLLHTRINWLLNDFLQRPEMLVERDGKITGELVAKAIEKTASLANDNRFLGLRKKLWKLTQK